MNDVATSALHPQAQPQTTLQEIVVDEVFPHAPELICKTPDDGRAYQPLADATDRIPSRHREPLHLPDDGRRRLGRHDRLRGTESGPNESLLYRWRGGDKANAGYGSPLDTVVSWTLTKVDNGPRCACIRALSYRPTTRRSSR